MQRKLKVSVRVVAVLALVLTFAIGCTTPTYVSSPTAEKRASGLMNAAAVGDLVQVKSFIAAKADVNAKTHDGETALMYAVWGDHAEVVKALLMAGADVNAKAKDGRTALKIAQIAGQTGMVKLLRQAGGKE